MDPTVAIVVGTVMAGSIASITSVIVAWMNGRAAMAREERLYARQDEVASKLLISNARAQEAAEDAKAHARSASNTLSTVAEDVKKLELSMNSMKDAQVALSGLEGEKRGREEEVARAAAASTTGPPEKD